MPIFKICKELIHLNGKIIIIIIIIQFNIGQRT